MSDSVTCDGCGTASPERRRHAGYLRLHIPDPPEVQARKDRDPVVGMMDFVRGEDLDACSVACMRTLLDVVEARPRATSGTTWTRP